MKYTILEFFFLFSCLFFIQKHVPIWERWDDEGKQFFFVRYKT